MEHHLQPLHCTGAVLQDRYHIEGLLGRGGFGFVYLVRDQQNGGQLAALKELQDQDGSEKYRLRLECEILMRLNHPSLPQVWGVFEQDNRVYMLMEYIEGPNLEILRKRQATQRFSFAEVVGLLQPIITAVSYLHQQDPPLMHRDIKPANIIVPENGDQAILVDFGIAKEYYADATTTAIRHCSPGYSSPEQYSVMGTDPRADVYGLGATCYTLLTGTPPSDALHRMTTLASKGVDTLVSVDEMVPDLPLAAVEAIHCALAINYERRFPTSEDFWNAFTAKEYSPVRYEQNTSESLPIVRLRRVGRADEPIRHKQKARAWLWLALAVLLITSLIPGLGIYTASRTSNQHAKTFPATQGTPQVHVPSPQPTRSALESYPVLKDTYAGTLDNLLTQTTTDLLLTSIQQNAQAIKGTVVETQLHTRRSFTGVIDASKHLLFTATGQKGLVPLFFEGTVRTDGSLVGNYCSVDASGQCAGGEYGLWSVSPSA